MSLWVRRVVLNELTRGGCRRGSISIRSRECIRIWRRGDGGYSGCWLRFAVNVSCRGCRRMFRRVATGSYWSRQLTPTLLHGLMAMS